MARKLTHERPWTDGEIARLAEMVGELVPLDEMAAELRRSQSSIKSKSHRLGIDRRSRQHRRDAIAARFWSKVEKTDGCWLWTGATARCGYGTFGLGVKGIDRRMVAAHRFSWELENGPIPDGLFVCHTCDNPPCVRSDHLWLGTQSDNMRDAYEKGRLLLPPQYAAAQVPR